MLKKVYICAPLKDNVRENLRNIAIIAHVDLRKVRKYTEYALRCGTAPVVPHFYALCLNDKKANERTIGMKAGQSLLWFCDELWVFGDVITEGMQAEIQFCKTMNIRIRYINDNDLRKKLGGINYENEKN